MVEKNAPAEVENMTQCENCGEPLDNLTHTWASNHGLCERCGDQYTECGCCERLLLLDDSHYDDYNDYNVCEDCMQEYSECKECEIIRHKDEMEQLWSEDEYVCYDCAEEFYYKCERCGLLFYNDEGFVLCPDCRKTGHTQKLTI